jgi:ABC-type Fe3+-hydroxamate transport system substrate-binding protein|tara:strand:+ start:223 stop:414 length:192 start_codon:yes stop_codon:yes gene_type:complete
MTITQKNIDQMTEREKKLFKLQNEKEEIESYITFWQRKLNLATKRLRANDEKLREIEEKIKGV